MRTIYFGIIFLVVNLKAFDHNDYTYIQGYIVEYEDKTNPPNGTFLIDAIAGKVFIEQKDFRKKYLNYQQIEKINANRKRLIVLPNTASYSNFIYEHIKRLKLEMPNLDTSLDRRYSYKYFTGNKKNHFEYNITPVILKCKKYLMTEYRYYEAVALIGYKNIKIPTYVYVCEEYILLDNF